MLSVRENLLEVNILDRHNINADITLSNVDNISVLIRLWEIWRKMSLVIR